MRDRKAVVAVEIAGAEELAGAFEIREAELMRAEHAQESGGAAAVLEVGPAVAVRRGHVEAVAHGRETGWTSELLTVITTGSRKFEE